MIKRLVIILILFLGIGATSAFAAGGPTAPDPIRLATGARALGMGKAFVGLADDVSSVFLNPAGLANPTHWQLTSMSGKLLDEFNYTSISGLYPSSYGNIGFAFIQSGIGGALPTTIEAGSSAVDPIYIPDATLAPMSYYNNLLVLSYGDKLQRLLKLPVLAGLGNRLPGLKEANFGVNLKLFAVGVGGGKVDGCDAIGTEIDLGLQGKPLPWLSLGSNLQNALPSSLGGKLAYKNGWTEEYPATLKLGVAVNTLGQENALRTLGEHQLKVLADLDYELSRSSNVPLLCHLGFEWMPNNLIAIRAGIDQEMAGANKVSNNLTSGVGFYYGDFRFDYAYHQFLDAPGVDNHFFSLSYGISSGKQDQGQVASYSIESEKPGTGRVASASYGIGGFTKQDKDQVTSIGDKLATVNKD